MNNMAAISQKQLAEWYEAYGTELKLYARQWLLPENSWYHQKKPWTFHNDQILFQTMPRSICNLQWCFFWIHLMVFQENFYGFWGFHDALPCFELIVFLPEWIRQWNNYTFFMRFSKTILWIFQGENIGYAYSQCGCRDKNPVLYHKHSLQNHSISNTSFKISIDSISAEFKCCIPEYDGTPSIT